MFLVVMTTGSLLYFHIQKLSIISLCYCVVILFYCISSFYYLQCVAYILKYLRLNQNKSITCWEVLTIFEAGIYSLSVPNAINN